MLTDLLNPTGAALQILSATLTSERVQVELATTVSTVPCSTCHVDARRIHSRYQRTLADLPLAQLPVRLQLHVRRFYCDNPACSRRTFSEWVPDMILPFARRTIRLATEQRRLGLDVGGAAGARIAKRQGMPVSEATLLRLVRRAEPAAHPTPVKIGVDDFAFRKGQRYGTILVDLEKHCPVDLLPDRSAATWEKWLQKHPGVELIARDRASDYADGATRAAPDAVQVADRFHLCQNVREMVQRLLERHQAALRAATQVDRLPEGASSQAPPTTPSMVDEGRQSTGEVSLGLTNRTVPPAKPRIPVTSKRGEARRAARLERYRRVRALRADGRTLREIAVQLQLGRNTVRRFATADEFPERATRRAMPSKLDPFVPYLEQQLAAGQENGMESWRQLRDQYGYRGSRALVSRWVARHRDLCPAPEPAAAQPKRRGAPPAAIEARPRPAPRRCSARQAAFLLMRRAEDLDADEQGLVERLCAQNGELELARRLTGEFLRMVRERNGECLEDWLRRAEESAIAEIRSFVAGIRRDQAAVRAGLTLPDSSGQVEGQVNRLKFIQRSMYGRAKFDLLRHRVLVS